MKTKIFFISLCILSCFAISNLNAQSNSSTKTFQSWYSTNGWWVPVYCNGEQVDVLQNGFVTYHLINHYVDGTLLKRTLQAKGELTSEMTGEVFQIKEIDQIFKTDSWYCEFHYNLIGDQGSHYIGRLTYSYSSGEIVDVGQTVCH